MIKKRFGVMPDGTTVYSYILENEYIRATILNLGGILHSLTVNGREIVCAYGSVEDILNGEGYHGSIIGRYANRIRDGKFTLNGKEYILAKNEKGITHLHGGNEGFNRKVFQATQVVKPDREELVLTLFSPDGEEGYPGNLDVSVTYALCGKDFSIHYTAESDADTVLNMTNHAYFNLNGYDSGSVLSHTLRIPADAISAVDEQLIPIAVRPVAGTPFDFNEEKEVGRDINADDEQLRLGGGYDHNFILRRDEPLPFDGKTLYTAAVLKGNDLTMTVYTDCPGVQLYTGNFMNCPIDFKGGVKQIPRNALCLETQFPPDSPNHGEAILRKYEKFDKTTLFRFS